MYMLSLLLCIISSWYVINWLMAMRKYDCHCRLELNYQRHPQLRSCVIGCTNALQITVVQFYLLTWSKRISGTSHCMTESACRIWWLGSCFWREAAFQIVKGMNVKIHCVLESKVSNLSNEREMMSSNMCVANRPQWSWSTMSTFSWSYNSRYL